MEFRVRIPSKPKKRFRSISTPASTKANRVQSPAGSQDFRKWETCRTMPLVGGFSRGSPVFPAPSLRRRSIFTSITIIGSQDLADKSRAELRAESDDREVTRWLGDVMLHHCRAQQHPSSAICRHTSRMTLLVLDAGQ
ncbi:hypothetical protein PR048_017227 [Dryococelus australis]|uniref:Uncharacterized protein n=1 Tax=Dryococelus australis TaxID=614101 RepID=A0ABQ9H8X6_9NEOP|nr:hypothetical protein PR048_017227 [Dryococelus australis]